MARFESLSVGKLTVPTVSTAAGGSYVSLSLTPAAVGPATVAAQSLTVPGVKTGDIVVVVSTPIANATALVNVTATADNTISAKFVNPTAGGLTPTAGTYTFLVFSAA